jgi:hypothetical protein
MLDAPIDYVNCSGGSTAIITRNGTLYTTGSSGYLSTKVFTHVPTPSRVKGVSVGYGFFFVTTGTFNN